MMGTAIFLFAWRHLMTWNKPKLFGIFNRKGQLFGGFSFIGKNLTKQQNETAFVDKKIVILHDGNDAYQYEGGRGLWDEKIWNKIYHNQNRRRYNSSCDRLITISYLKLLLMVILIGVVMRMNWIVPMKYRSRKMFLPLEHIHHWDSRREYDIQNWNCYQYATESSVWLRLMNL